MQIIPAIIFSTLISASVSAHAALDIINLTVGGEISPGMYGQVQFGNAPPPPVYYPQPVIIVRQPGVVLEPIYLSVPPGHAKHWSKNCRKYDACNRPVYFVRSAEYEPGYNQRNNRKHHDDEGHGNGHGDHGGHGKHD